LVIADGPLVYRASGDSEAFPTLEGASLERIQDELVLHGKLARLDVKHIFTLPPDKPIMEEHVVTTNYTGGKVVLSALEIGFSPRVVRTDDEAETAGDISRDRWRGGEVERLPADRGFLRDALSGQRQPGGHARDDYKLKLAVLVPVTLSPLRCRRFPRPSYRRSMRPYPAM
jgi:hypothetical protein